MAGSCYSGGVSASLLLSSSAVSLSLSLSVSSSWQSLLPVAVQEGQMGKVVSWLPLHVGQDGTVALQSFFLRFAAQWGHFVEDMQLSMVAVTLTVRESKNCEIIMERKSEEKSTRHFSFWSKII